MTTGSVDVSDGGVDDGRFRGTTDLGKVWKESCEILCGVLLEWRRRKGEIKLARKRPLRVSRR
jgi:hypothetical protein